MNNTQTNQTENESEDNPYLTPCEELGYSEGDVFEVIGGNSLYYCEGMIVKLKEDDGSSSPYFRYVSGNNATQKADYIAIALNYVRKIHQKAESAKPTEVIQVARVIQDKLLYSTEDIDAAWVNLHWAEDSKALLIKKLNEVTDPEYKEYLRLKDKYETK